MKHLGIVLVVLSLPMSAHADNALSGALSVGVSAGAHDHHDGARAKLGANLDGQLRFGMITVGGSLGLDDYALMDGAPVKASTLATHVGIAVPFAETQNRAGRIAKFVAIAAVEGGVHHFSPEGERTEFLGGTTSYYGDTRSRTFLGVRTGAEIAVRRAGWSNSVVFSVELIGRRDLRSAELKYDEIGCGGLFFDDNECSAPEHGMIHAGGNELGIATSIGVQFGGG